MLIMFGASNDPNDDIYLHSARFTIDSVRELLHSDSEILDSVRDSLRSSQQNLN